MSKVREDQMIFMISQTPDGVPMVMLGIPAMAFDRMKDGHTSEFDFVKAGLNFRLMAFGCKDHSDGMRMIEEAAKANGTAILDQRRSDFSISKKPRTLRDKGSLEGNP